MKKVLYQGKSENIEAKRLIKSRIERIMVMMEIDETGFKVKMIKRRRVGRVLERGESTAKERLAKERPAKEVHRRMFAFIHTSVKKIILDQG